MVTVTLEYRSDEPFHVVAPEMPICINQKSCLTVEGVPERTKVEWSNGGRNRQTQILDAGWHWVEYGEFCNPTKDSVYVTLEDCEPTLYVPNAFKPTGTGLNETFHVQGHNIGMYEIFIYDRWGALLFHSKDINDPWDGSHHGNALQMGAYIYVIKASSIFNEYEFIQKTGTVMLLR